jgi:hypothetical protein
MLDRLQLRMNVRRRTRGEFMRVIPIASLIRLPHALEHHLKRRKALGYRAIRDFPRALVDGTFGTTGRVAALTLLPWPPVVFRSCCFDLIRPIAIPRLTKKVVRLSVFDGRYEALNGKKNTASFDGAGGTDALTRKS